MSAGNVFENDMMELFFRNADIPGIGDAGGLRGSVAAGNLYVALHTSDPGEAGDQSSSEANYTGYARVSVSRDAGGWTVTNNLAQNAALIGFGQCTGGSNTVTHFSVGSAASGAGKMMFYGALNTPRTITAGITPEFAAGSLQVDVD